MKNPTQRELIESHIEYLHELNGVYLEIDDVRLKHDLISSNAKQIDELKVKLRDLNNQTKPAGSESS